MVKLHILVQFIRFVIDLWKELRKTDPKLIAEVRESFTSFASAKGVKEKNDALVKINQVINRI